MSHRNFRILKKVFVLAISVVLVAVFAGFILSYYTTQKIEDTLASKGVTFDDLAVSLLSRSVTIHGFKFNSTDSAQAFPSTARVEKITFSDIGVYQALVKKNLNISEIRFEKGEININQNDTLRDSASAPEKLPLNGISIGQLFLENIVVAVVKDSLLQYSGTLEITIDDIRSSDSLEVTNWEAYTIKNVEATITRLLFQDQTGLYQTKIGTLRANSQQQTLQLDSILLIPQFSKYKFSRAANKQIDRINTFIRHIEVSGLRYNLLRDSTLVASKILIRAGEVYSFRDKRMPFKEKVDKPLPMEALQNLDFDLVIDTIQLKDCRITYEEFPPEGFKSGKVTFEQLEATLTNLRNRKEEDHADHAMLKASARLMGKGLIEASFTLPFDKNQAYHAEGKISRMPLHHINPALENLAFINVESGILNEMNFNFDYTSENSTGKLTINYENLKINGLKKEKSTIINDLKTFLINLIIKNDKDKSVSRESRTGTIAFERDKKRQIFNYWWKSVLSGIKGSVL